MYGSIRPLQSELWHIAFPLLLIGLSMNFMMFIDRLFLARYSTEAMNSAVAAGMVVTIFNIGAFGIASIAEVFVGQYNGRKKYRTIGEPVWQMIWFGVMTIVIFIPLALFAGKLLLPDQFEARAMPYYQLLMYFGPLTPISVAVSAFFIGRGKSNIVTWSAVIGNVINIILDITLIFGVEGYIPAMGIKGAAWATVISQIFQLIFITVVFLSPRNQKRYGTNRFKLKLDLFYKCLRIGVPAAAGNMIEFTAWTILLHIMAMTSIIHMTVFTICQSIYILAVFSTLAISKAATAISANFIGAKKWDMLEKLLHSGTKLHVYLSLVVAVPLLLFPDPIIHAFLPNVAGVELTRFLRLALIWAWVAFALEGLVWFIGGILTAAGDTKFVMGFSAINAWLFALIPGYLLFKVYGFSPSLVWSVVAVYQLMNLICFYWRYKGDVWKFKNIH